MGAMIARKAELGAGADDRVVDAARSGHGRDGRSDEPERKEPA
jgi:hypothetical protein